MLEELARGDVRALGDLYDVHARRVYHVLLAHAVDEHVAEDALQEASLSLVDRGEPFCGFATSRPTSSGRRATSPVVSNGAAGARRSTGQPRQPT